MLESLGPFGTHRPLNGGTKMLINTSPKKIVAVLAASLLIPIFILPTSSFSAGRTAASVANTLLNGKGVPAASLGINGDFYIDKTAMNLYGPKALGKWPLPVSMRGAVGPMGPVGVDGKAGERGAVSASSAGTTGSKGETGAIGPVGATGAPGSSGSGAAGPMGATGAAGPMGATGINGVNGTAGSSGTNGTNGISGASGDRGLQGSTGSTGDQGLTGLTGTQGTQGVQGNQGNVGSSGSNGAQGLQGATGETGTVGAQGVQGATGPSEVTWGAITFSTLMLAAPVYGTSSPIGIFKAGNSYMVDIFIYGESVLSDARSLRITFATSPTAQTIHSQYLVINGLSVRSSMDIRKTESSILVKILISGLETTSDFSITATVGSGSDTSDDAVTLRGNFTSQLVGRAIFN